jgi:hypothetical protein
MDGMLAMGDFHILRFVDVWVLQDYDDDDNTLRLRVHLRNSCWVHAGRSTPAWKDGV